MTRQYTEKSNIPSAREILSDAGGFVRRHIGPSERDCQAMLEVIGFPTLEAMIDRTVPASIRLKDPLKIEKARSEYAALAELRKLASRNKVFRAYIGMGY